MKHFLIALLLFSSSLTAATLELIEPKDNTITSRRVILFKGSAEGFRSITINGAYVPIKQNRFSGRFVLEKAKSYNYYTIIGTTKAGKKVTLNRKIYLKEDPENITDSSLSAYPKDSAIVKYKSILITGRAKEMKRLTINDEEVKLKRNGKFSHKVEMAEENAYTSFKIIGLGNDNTIHTLKRSYFYKVKTTPTKIEPTVTNKTQAPSTPIRQTPPSPAIIKKTEKKPSQTDTISITRKELIKHYGLFDWREKTLRFDQETSKLPNYLLDIYQEHHLLLEHKEEIMVALPLYEIFQPITDVSDYIMRLVNTQFGANKHLKVVWYNKRQDYWELLYRRQDGTLTTFFWLLNDQEINPYELTDQNRVEINTFLASPFSVAP
jgi:hypothetical protein